MAVSMKLDYLEIKLDLKRILDHSHCSDACQVLMTMPLPLFFAIYFYLTLERLIQLDAKF